MVSPAQLSKLGVREPGSFPLFITTALSFYGLTTKLRIAAYLANVLHETGNLTAFRESLNYSPQGLTATWPSHFTPALAAELGRIGPANRPTRAANEPLIAEIAYGGRMGNRPPGWGDGWGRLGRGGIQITGEANYQAAAKALQVPIGSLAAYLESPEGAVKSAAWFIAEFANVLPYADKGDIRSVRSILNVGHVVPAGQDASIIGLDDVTARYKAALAIL